MDPTVPDLFLQFWVGEYNFWSLGAKNMMKRKEEKKKGKGKEYEFEQTQNNTAVELQSNVFFL